MQFQSFSSQSELYAQACELRNKVLRIPIGLDLYDEDLTAESICLHFGFLEAGELIASVMIVPHETQATLRQMCVAPSWQRHGIGTKLIAEVEANLQTRGFQSITLSARTTAAGFYEKLGYQRLGAELISVGIPHVRMAKILDG